MIKLFNDLFKTNTPPAIKNNRVFVTSEIVGTALLVAEAYLKEPDNYVIIASNLYSAQKLIATLSTFVEQKNILFYPQDDMLFTEVLGATQELEAQRVYTLYKAQSTKEKYIYVTNLAGALKPCLEQSYFQKMELVLKVGNALKMSELTAKLQEFGYQRVSNVEQSMQYAVRGDIVDFYSVNEDLPTRIEFFDEEIESIRDFNVSTQISAKVRQDVVLIRAKESKLFKTEEAEFLGSLKNKLFQEKKELNLLDQETLELNIKEKIEEYLNGNEQALSKYLLLHPLFRHSFISHIFNPTLILANEPQIEAALQVLSGETEAFDSEEVRKLERIPNVPFHLTKSVLNVYPRRTTREFSEDGNEEVLLISPVPLLKSKEDLLFYLEEYKKDGYSVHIALNNKTQVEQIKQTLSDNNITFSLEEEDIEAEVTITYHYFPHGFALSSAKVVVLTSKELFNVSRGERRYNTRFKAGSVIRSYEQLTPGDYVVHEYHGIGQYLKIENIYSFGANRDYIKMKFAGDEELAIPLEQIHLIRKYSGRDGVAPKLNRLGTQEWTKTKQKINEKINDIADSLLEIEAKRHETPGYAFPDDDEFQREFELGFPYELTPDQASALVEIKADMEKPFIMDRLLAGDVGFGKTEIALRAAFKAISAGKQVLFLCPTTLLARQHYNVALDRFDNFGVRSAMISRLVTPKAKKETVKQFNEGKIHLLIGTHSLLNIDFSKANVGFLIVDEEQRFGVEQKEAIKKMKNHIDVLTLSATPIPRTLQMALVGLRSLSQINTAPQERMPIQTYVIKRDDYVIKELIERELNRDGQVFYLYNRIDTIYRAANRISNLVPNSKIGVIHGQMDKNESEDVMNSFYNGEVNVLVTTSIIENGIDVPNANVIIIENADNFGLAQLYQIKGRVGRGDRIAYAYLLYKGEKVMNDDARKRLQAIQEFTKLGSGYKIAERDLMIRGAGDILGAEQSGFISSVGIDMYLKMLSDTLNEKKYNLSSEPIEKNINLSGLDAYIPDSWASPSEKFDLYLEIKQSKKLTTLREVEQKTIDMYGKLPASINNLFLKRQVELMVNSKVGYIEEVVDEDTFVDIVPGKAFLNIPGSMMLLNEKIGNNFTNLRFISQFGKMKIRILKKNEWFTTYAMIVRTIVSIVRSKIKEDE